MEWLGVFVIWSLVFNSSHIKAVLLSYTPNLHSHTKIGPNLENYMGDKSGIFTPPSSIFHFSCKSLAYILG